jgi:predicted metallopeptidase
MRPENGEASDATKATRYLCAGVYLDREFREMIIRRVYNDSKHMVAPSYGFDLVPVVIHAWRAWWLETLKWLLLLAILFVAFIRAPAAAIAAVALFGLLWLAALAVKSAMIAIPLKAKERRDRFLRRTRWHSEIADLATHLRTIRLAGIGGGYLIISVIALSVFARIPLPQLLQETATIATLVAFVACGCSAAQRVALHHTFKRPLPWSGGARYQTINHQQHHPYVIYKRPTKEDEKPKDFRDILELDDAHKPFVGAGRLIHRWNPPLHIHLLRRGPGSMKDRELHPSEIKAHELVTYLKKEMHRLDGQDDATSLPNFSTTDRIYIAEADVGGDREWLKEYPSEQQITDIIERPFDRFHHFLEIQTSVQGELVTTVFLRTTVKGRALSLDFAACALTRTPDKYHLLDEYGEDGTAAILRTAIRALIDLPTDIIQSWRLVHVPAILIGVLRAHRVRVMDPKRGVKIGAKLSVREEKRMPWESAQLDRTLISDHVKLIEDRLLKAATEFLRKKDVDVSEFEERATNIINTGIMNFGESMNVNNSAIGSNAIKMDLPESFINPGGHA